jgi:hypothetical protein
MLHVRMSALTTSSDPVEPRDIVGDGNSPGNHPRGKRRVGQSRSRRGWFDADVIVGGTEPLSAGKIPLRCLDARVTEQELNLLQAPRWSVVATTSDELVLHFFQQPPDRTLLEFHVLRRPERVDRVPR